MKEKKLLIDNHSQNFPFVAPTLNWWFFSVFFGVLKLPLFYIFSKLKILKGIPLLRSATQKEWHFNYTP